MCECECLTVCVSYEREQGADRRQERGQPSVCVCMCVSECLSACVCPLKGIRRLIVGKEGDSHLCVCVMCVFECVSACVCPLKGNRRLIVG
jgi:hypothetical protein